MNKTSKTPTKKPSTKKTPQARRDDSAIVNAMANVVPQVIQAVMASREAELAHELRLLELHPEYAMKKLEMLVQAGRQPSMADVLHNAFETVMANMASAQPDNATAGDPPADGEGGRGA